MTVSPTVEWHSKRNFGPGGKWLTYKISTYRVSLLARSYCTLLFTGFSWQIIFRLCFQENIFWTLRIRKRVRKDFDLIVCNSITYSVSMVFQFLRWWVIKSKIFGQKSTCSKEIVVFCEYSTMNISLSKSDKIVLSKWIFM